jgi:DNA-binding response OmpR family regulator
MDELRVMVVEDNDSLRDATVTILRQEGFNVIGVACAEDVDDTPLKGAPDIYVIDLSLPGEDGISLAQRLRRAQPLAGIVMTTARTRLQDRLTGYKMGADIYLPKPVDPQELVATLSNLSDRLKYQAASQTLQLLRAQCLLRGPDGESRLSEPEAQVLIALSRAKDQILERWQLVAQLDPDNSGMSADNLQNRLSQLRKKVAACSVRGESIKAIRGLGYKLCIQVLVI